MFRTLLRSTLLALWGLAFVVPVSAQKVEPEKKDDKKEAESKLVKAGDVTGDVIHVEPQKGMFRVRVTYVYYEPNQGAINAVAQARLNVAKARNRDELINAQRELARASSQSMYNTKTNHKDLTIEAGEEMQVRLLQPKADFDEMGNLKKFTPKEIAALKGKDGLFDGEMSDIHNGVKVRVTLLRNKPTKPKGRDDVAVEEDKLYAAKVIVGAAPPPK